MDQGNGRRTSKPQGARSGYRARRPVFGGVGVPAVTRPQIFRDNNRGSWPGALVAPSLPRAAEILLLVVIRILRVMPVREEIMRDPLNRWKFRVFTWGMFA